MSPILLRTDKLIHILPQKITLHERPRSPPRQHPPLPPSPPSPPAPQARHASHSWTPKHIYPLPLTRSSSTCQFISECTKIPIHILPRKVKLSHYNLSQGPPGGKKVEYKKNRGADSVDLTKHRGLGGVGSELKTTTLYANTRTVFFQEHENQGYMEKKKGKKRGNGAALAVVAGWDFLSENKMQQLFFFPHLRFD